MGLLQQCAFLDKCFSRLATVFVKHQKHPLKFSWRSLGITSACKSPSYERAQYPSPEEVVELNGKFQDPQQIIHNLVQPMQLVDDNFGPKFEYEPLKSRGSIFWKVKMKFIWPVPFSVISRASDLKRGQHYASLLACDSLVNIGVLSSNDGTLLPYQSILEEAQDYAFRKIGIKCTVGFTSSRTAEKKQSQWTTDLHIGWPFCIKAQGHGLSRQDAERNACVVAFTRLKGKKLLSRTGHGILFPHHYPLYPTKNSIDRVLEHSNFEPDFELYTDASKHGYGAYLITKPGDDDNSFDSKIRWMNECYPESDEELLTMKAIDYSCFIELYAMLAAVYTWKKKFAGKKVLWWCDSLGVVNIINGGINPYKSRELTKMFMVLQNTCETYEINLLGKHLYREENVAADHLSRAQVDEFHQLIPNTFAKGKKTKKLLFFRPIYNS